MPSPTTFAPVMNLLSSRAPETCVEPLESRIAPAILLIGNTTINDDPNDTEYQENGGRGDDFDDLLFTNTSTSTDPISLAVDSDATTNTYFVRLNKGDVIRSFSEAENYED